MSEEFQSDFESRRLYKQSCLTEEGLTVTNAVFAIRWTYPGASSHTTGRVRITCMYFEEGGGISPVSGAIERLSDRGWLFIDEFCNDSIDFNNSDEFVEHMMLLAHSFIMGVPVDVITGDVTEQRYTSCLVSNTDHVRRIHVAARYLKHSVKDWLKEYPLKVCSLVFEDTACCVLQCLYLKGSLLTGSPDTHSLTRRAGHFFHLVFQQADLQVCL